MIDLGPAWSMTSYGLRRAALLLRISQKTNPQEIVRAPMCARCGTTKHLQIHHVDGNGDSHGIGGWAQLRKIELEEKVGVKLQLLCGRKANGCHQKVHDEQHLGELAGGSCGAEQEGS